MSVYHSHSWQINVAAGWLADRDNDCVTIANHDGVGALQISAFQKPNGDVTKADLLDAADLDEPAQQHLRNIECGDFQGLALSFADDQTFWRQWWIASGATMLFVTYNCDVEHKESDREIIDEMIASLKMRRG
jgi:hypothetical protein